ncbi:hypothetical protein, conserved [Pediculus humanus corporis]|uniref:FLYWCH-type domain-containing protein n=1 Tax=Pediculus humanus subsp. corporis TaxID=121224 RepID=E0W2L3_PEDHC|nr:uncharacterized protein Phum_PHUM595750 [Pediculus humanus corporis]EEB19869.1 hypothetical protein, conserved [Pediculus humanus corporis]
MKGIDESVNNDGSKESGRLTANGLLPTLNESQNDQFEKMVLPCFLRTVKGGMKLCDLNGFRFIRNRVDRTKIYWTCERKKNECRARAISNVDHTGVSFNEVDHNHSPPEWGSHHRSKKNVKVRLGVSSQPHQIKYHVQGIIWEGKTGGGEEIRSFN